MQPSRHVLLDPARPLAALTATARGMIDSNFIHAAQRAHTELMKAIASAAPLPAIRSRLCIFPDVPKAANDAGCRCVAGVLFGHELATGRGACLRPEVPLTGSLAWMSIEPGRYAVFTHVGPYDTLHRSWEAIWRDWLPGSGEVLRRAAPMELGPVDPDAVPPAQLRTEIWIPVA